MAAHVSGMIREMLDFEMRELYCSDEKLSPVARNLRVTSSLHPETIEIFIRLRILFLFQNNCFINHTKELCTMSFMY